MPRSPIRSKEKSVTTDDGSVLFSVVHGEQRHYTMTVNPLVLTGMTISAKVAEAENEPEDLENVPMFEDPTVTVVDLPIIDQTASNFKFVIPKTLIDNWKVKPTPDDPIYGFFSVEIADAGFNEHQQVIVPLRGLIEIRYNPVRSINVVV